MNILITFFLICILSSRNGLEMSNLMSEGDVGVIFNI